ncbi:hypothetical protein JCM8208_003849 [Rhodotorula glutinis]
MGALDSALLLEDIQAPVSLADLDSLSPAQLAVASLRPDLPTLVRQRAHIHFLERKSMYRTSDKRNSQQQPLLDHPLDFALPDSPSTLSPIELLLILFNPHCQSPQAAQEASRLFLQRATEAQNERKGSQASSRPHELLVERCRIVRQGMSREAVGGLALEVTEEALVVTRGGQVLLQVLAEDITSFKYFLDSPSAQAVGDFHCMLEVAALHVGLEALQSVDYATIELVLGDVGASDVQFLQLEGAVERWSQSEGFAVEVIQTQSAGIVPTSAKRSRSPPLSPPPSRPAAGAAGSRNANISPAPPAAKRQ